MRTFVTAIKRSLLGLLVLLQIFFYPAAIWAQEVPADPPDGGTQSTVTETQTPPPDSGSASESASDQPPSTLTAPTGPQEPTGPQGPTGPQEPTGPQGPTGPTSPTGVSSSTYVYNDATGLWENDYYTWDPVTHKTAPKQKQNYSYNPATGMWDTTEWRFDAPSGKYVPNVVSVQAVPNDPLIANTGPNSANNINIGTNNDSTFDLFFDATISNTINSNATSGNASVLQNTVGGNALTGDANVIINLLNLLQSSWNPDLAFTSNINGTITGDLLLDPNYILNSGANSQNGINNTSTSNLDVNVAINGSIVNNVDATANSGNATVSENTYGGNATTGNANVLINILNLINSAISSGDSFLGVININGNLDGDILLPQYLVAQLDTTGPNSTNTINDNSSNTTTVTSVDNKTITNDIDLSAASGNATVSENTNGGNASTGDASTKINVYNLTGREIIGDNALLVFVNILGKWTGLIFNAPAGTSTVLGTGPNSTNTINDNSSNNTNVNSTVNSSIENNITGNAQSGDAEVSRNTNGGNAKTGNATASANVVNLIGSSLNMKGWFGVLFINVLGSWNGSFGVNTAAGNKPAVVAVPGSFAASAAGGSGQAFTFVPKTSTGGGTSSNTNAVSNQVLADAVSNALLANAKASDNANSSLPQITSTKHSRANWSFAIISGTMAIALIAGEQLIDLIRRR